jgi:hypothetical protein
MKQRGGQVNRLLAGVIKHTFTPHTLDHIEAFFELTVNPLGFTLGATGLKDERGYGSDRRRWRLHGCASGLMPSNRR